MNQEGALVLFSLDDQRYALDLGRVQRVVRVVAVTPLPKAPPIVLGLVDCGGEVIPVVNLRKRFNHPPRDARLSDQLIIATTGRRTVALLVDSVHGVAAAMGTLLPGLCLIAGAVKRPDGLILIHDLERLLSLEEDQAIDRALDADSAAPKTAGPSDTREEPSEP